MKNQQTIYTELLYTYLYMTKSQLVSVIVPVYGVEKYLETCVQSILTQTYENIEVILVDDGSLDSSGQLCDELAKSDIRIKAVHKKNEGLNMARKTGFEHSKGEWILFIDSDDAVHPQAVEILLAACSENLTDIAIGGYKRFWNDQELKDMAHITSPTVEKVGDIDTAIHWLIRDSPHKNVFMQTAWMKLFKRSLVEPLDWEYSDYRANEDEFMALQYYPKLTKGISIVPENLYFYRVNDQSITRGVYKNTFKGKTLTKFEMIEELYQKSMAALDSNYEKDITLRFAAQFIGFTEQYMRDGHLTEDIYKEYRKYFEPKVEEISKYQDELSQPYKDQFVAVKEKGVFGLVTYLLTLQAQHIENLEAIMRQNTVETEILQKPGIKLASRKLAGAVKRRVKRHLR